MPAIKDVAIVLKRLDYSETSQVLLFLTREHGPRRLIAKGIKRGTKKHFASGIDLLERGGIVFLPASRSSDGLGTLTEWQQLDAHLGLRNDLHRLYAAQYAAEITAAMTEEADPHPDLFDALSELLGHLARPGPPPFILLAAYQCTLLEAAGIWPDLNRCVNCGKPAPAGRAGYYSATSGGLTCRQCVTQLKEHRMVSGQTLAALRERLFTERTSRDAFDLLDYAISHAMGRPPRTARVLRTTVRQR